MTEGFVFSLNPALQHTTELFLIIIEKLFFLSYVSTFAINCSDIETVKGIFFQSNLQPYYENEDRSQ